MLKGKKIILGITGSIAAYKAAFLVRLLIKEGADVRVIMTPIATEFISPLTLSTLSGHPVAVELFTKDTGEWTNHVDLGLWADLVLIAPASANTMAKMANGIADNLLSTVYLSARCPVIIVPAMDMDMFKHSSTQKNLKILEGYGNIIIDAGTGELASGLSGKGRMEEPEKIVMEISNFFKKINKNLSFAGQKVLITAGPTFEAIDPVRFIGNHSSGKMGIQLAEAFAETGAEVHLVLGPVNLEIQRREVKVYKVVTAAEMNQVCTELFPSMNGAVLAAAVSDFTPLNPGQQKIKRGKEDLQIQLKPTNDIAAELGRAKSQKQWLVGFALETGNEVDNARKKLEKKNLDLIVLNSLRDKGAGFGYDTNQVSILDRHGNKEDYDLKDKAEVAIDIVKSIQKLTSGTL